MQQYEARDGNGAVVAMLAAADFADAELYAHRKLKGVAAIVPVADGRASLEEAWRRRHPDWSDEQIEVATAPLPGRHLPIVVPRQEATMPGIATTRPRAAARLGAAVGTGLRLLSEAGTEGDSKALEESWKHLHPTWSPEQIRIATTGR